VATILNPWEGHTTRKNDADRTATERTVGFVDRGSANYFGSVTDCRARISLQSATNPKNMDVCKREVHYISMAFSSVLPVPQKAGHGPENYHNMRFPESSTPEPHRVYKPKTDESVASKM
jgi:hypothetical protein